MIALSDIKRHCNVDHDEDDNLLEDYIAVAIASVEKSIGAKLSEYVDEEGALPADLKHVLRIMVAKYYEYREGDTRGKSQEVPFALAHLLAPYVKLS